MSDGLDRLADRLGEQITPAPTETEPRPVLRRWGEISAIVGTGAYDVELGGSGVVLPGVRALGYGAFTVGEPVVVEFAGSDPVIMGTVGPEDGWHVPALGSGWVDYGSGYMGAQYRKVHGVTHVQGLVKNGAAGTIFTLPAGYRPAAILIFAVPSNATFSNVYVLPNGNVDAAAPVSAAWVSLSDVSFVAEL